MSYGSLLSRLGYALFTVGLCLELLVAMALRDVLRWAHGGLTRIVRQGQRQLEAVE